MVLASQPTVVLLALYRRMGSPLGNSDALKIIRILHGRGYPLEKLGLKVN